MTDRRSARTTLYVLPATASPQVLVIRRGPSKWWHFLLWDRDTGLVTPGSWFHGLVYPGRCDLAPKGDWMVLLAYRGTRPPYAWTALCQPPNVQALVFWPQETVALGGGFFDARSPILWLNHVIAEEPEVREPHPWEFGHLEDPGDLHGTVAERLERDGWKAARAADDGHAWHRIHRRTRARIDLHLDPGAAADATTFLAGEGVRYSFTPPGATSTLPLDDAIWAGWNAAGELCMVSGGRLLCAPTTQPHSPRVILDLNGLTPRPLSSPPRSEGPPR